MNSLAAETRAAVDAHPFIRDGLRADVVNFAAAARFLDIDGGDDAIATALRRYADELPPIESLDATVRVSMQSGVGRDGDDLLGIDDVTFGSDAGSMTAIQAIGDIDTGLVGTILSRLAAADIEVVGLGHAEDVLVLVIERRDATQALTIVEDAATGFA